MWTCCPQELELLCRPWQTCKRQRSFGYVSFPLLLSFWRPFLLELHFFSGILPASLHHKMVVRSFEDFATLVPIFNRGLKSRQGFCNLARFRFSHLLVGAITEVIIAITIVLILQLHRAITLINRLVEVGLFNEPFSAMCRSCHPRLLLVKRHGEKYTSTGEKRKSFKRGGCMGLYQLLLHPHTTLSDMLNRVRV